MGIVIGSLFLFGDRFGQDPGVTSVPPAGTSAPPATGVPSVTSAALPTATVSIPTAPPTPTDSTVPVPPGWRLIISDPFDTNGNGWETGGFSNEWATQQWDLLSGKYHWVAMAHRSYATENAIGGSVTDFYVSVVAIQTDGTDDASFGVAFRILESDTFYRFGVSNDGSVFFSRSIDWQATPLVDWVPSSAVRINEENTITVIGQGSHFRGYVNGQLVAEVDDAMIPSGQVGIDLGFDGIERSVTVDFDDFILYTP